MRKILFMNTKWGLAIIFMVATLLFSLGGCKKVKDTYELRVNAVVEDTYHKKAWAQFQYHASTKRTTTIRHPERNEVSIRYNGEVFTLDNKNTYEYCKDKIGQSIPCILEVKEYNDGSLKQEIVAVVLGGE